MAMKDVDAAPRSGVERLSRARSMSAGVQRARPATTGPRMCVATSLTDSASASEAIGKPGFDHVHAERRELARHRQLLVGPQREARAPVRHRAASCRRS